MGYYELEKWCQYCGKKFISFRDDSKYCTNACRTKAYRKRKGIPNPDFSLLKGVKYPSELEKRKILLLSDLESMKSQELLLENDFAGAQIKFATANDMYSITPGFWSRENLEHRKFEIIEIRNKLNLHRQKRLDLEKSYEDLEEGIDSISLKNKGLVSSADMLKKLSFEHLDFKGKWVNLFGNPSSTFFMIVYGLPKSGKTTFALQFSNYLKQFGKVVFISLGKGIGFSMQKLLIENDVSDIDLSKASNREEIHYVLKKGEYSFAVIDGINLVNLSGGDIEEIRVKFSNTAFVLVFQTDKIKDKKTITLFKYESDMYVEVEDGFAMAKGRFSTGGKCDIFESMY